MSRLILWNVISLDGYFEGVKSWDVEWFHSFFGKDQEEFSIEQLRHAGALLFGRVTYEGMAAYWQTATGVVADYMNSLPKVVFSRTLERAEWNNTRLIHDHAAEEAAKLKREMDGDLFDIWQRATVRRAAGGGSVRRGAHRNGPHHPRARRYLVRTRSFPPSTQTSGSTPAQVRHCHLAL